MCCNNFFNVQYLLLYIYWIHFPKRQISQKQKIDFSISLYKMYILLFECVCTNFVFLLFTFYVHKHHQFYVCAVLPSVWRRSMIFSLKEKKKLFSHFIQILYIIKYEKFMSLWKSDTYIQHTKHREHKGKFLIAYMYLYIFFTRTHVLLLSSIRKIFCCKRKYTHSIYTNVITRDTVIQKSLVVGYTQW